MRFTVRQYRLEDFNTLWAIDQSCFDPEIAYSRYELQVYLRRPGAFTLVADMDGQAQEPLKNDPLANDDPANQSSILGFIIIQIAGRL